MIVLWYEKMEQNCGRMLMGFLQLRKIWTASSNPKNMDVAEESLVY